jgi:predicted P-loop ATPase
LAYGRLATEVPRQFIIIGTTNSYAYLEDSTGNRRFWPVRIEHFDVEWVKASREQLWAEAAHREAQGESIRLDPKLWPMATLQQERRRVHDAWEETLAKHFTGNYYRLTTDEVWEYLCIPIERRDARAQHRVARVMQNLGFRRASVRHREMKGPDGRGLVVKGWARGGASGKLDVADEDAG